MTVQTLLNYAILTASFITAISVVANVLKKSIAKLFSPLNEKIIDMDIRECRMFLIDFLNDIENGVTKDEVQLKFAHELYDHYKNDLRQNSYVHDKWERLMGK